ncbi:MAG: thioredoxin-like domain-containing protein [Planctomycetota bacterium]
MLRFARFPAGPVFCLLLVAMLLMSVPLPTTADEPSPQGPGGNADAPQNPFPKAVQVPEDILDGGAEWLNTARPITVPDLKGKIVLLDFWTYCCINCMHILPDLKYLEEKYADQLVVIGVHSAKFDNERDAKNIRDAIQRYEIEHPVVNDNEMLIWRKFGTRAWPTVALIDPEGRYCGSQSGEGNRELLDLVIGKMVTYHRHLGTLNEKPLVFESEASKAPVTPLRYPGKVLADAAGKRLFMTDSNHNRIVVTSFTGELQSVIGSGRPGRRDGPLAEAEFFRPQGTALVGSTLYVADTENHLIRAVNLETAQVSTLAGTGNQGQPGQPPGDDLLTTALNSPWSIVHVSGTLYIAMAGPHQVWSHALGSQQITAWAGSGREDVINGPLAEAAFAQPSEIIADANGKMLYLVDSEGSSIRRIPLDGSGGVSTIAGTSELPRGQSLFAFGDVDAVGADARFQHPLGIAIDQNQLYIADSYNHKIRRIELDSAAVTTWIGDGKPGAELNPPRLSEPGGLAIADGRLFIADTNNHRILSVSLADRSTSEISIPGLTPPTARARSAQPETASAIDIPPQTLAATDALQVTVRLRIPEGQKLNPGFPVSWSVFAPDEQPLVPASALSIRNRATPADDGTAAFTVPLTGQPGESVVFLQLSFGYCDADGAGLCRLADGLWKIPLKLSTDGGDSRITLDMPADAF